MIQTRAELDAVLLRLEPELRKRFGRRRIGYFGSFARNEQNEKSDIDVLFDDTGIEKGALKFRSALGKILRRETKRKVDISPQSRLKSAYLSGVLEDARFLENGRFIGGHDFTSDPLRVVHRVKRYDVYVGDMIEAIRKIESYTKGYTFDEYRDDTRTVDAVQLRFIEIAEASKHVPQHVKDRYPEVPWERLIKLRNFVVHEYWEDYTEKVWDIAKNKLTKILPKLEKMKLEA